MSIYKAFGNVMKHQILRSNVIYGMKTGLFHNLSSLTDVPTLAVTTKLNTKYVREWANCMTACGVITMSDYRKEKIILPDDGIDLKFLENEKLLKDLDEKNMDKRVQKMLNASLKNKQFCDKDNLEGLSYIMDERSKTTPQIAKGIMKICTDRFKDKKISYLDFGCGLGDVTYELATKYKNAKITACDKNLANLNSLKKHDSVEYVFVNGKYAEHWEGKFDVIVMFQVLHDLCHREKVMKEVVSWLHDDGILVIVDPYVSCNLWESIDDLEKMIMLGMSARYCVYSCDCDDHIGVSWGYQNKEKAIDKMDMKIVDKIPLVNNFNYAYVCTKKNKKHSKK